MKEVIVGSASGPSLTMTAEDRCFILYCKSPEGEVWVYKMDPAEAHQILEAVSEYLAETP